MRNITLALDPELLDKGRKVAAELGLSLNGFIRAFLERSTGGRGGIEGRADWLDDLFADIDKTVKPKKIGWSRDELHRF